MFESKILPQVKLNLSNEPLNLPILKLITEKNLDESDIA